MSSDEAEDNNEDVSAPEDVIQFLESADIPLPDGLTVEKIKHRASEWTFEDDGFSFRMERHPSGPFLSTGRDKATPVRWHVLTRYSYDQMGGKWESKEIDRELQFDDYQLIHEEFEKPSAKEAWEPKIERVQNAENPEAVLEKEFAPTEEKYRDNFGGDGSGAKLEEILTILKKEFRKRAEVDDST